MKIVWNEYKKYDDGTQASWVEAKVWIGDKHFDFIIYDHSTDRAKESDEHYKREITHAYVISGLGYAIGGRGCKEAGLDPNCYGCDHYGVDRNSGYDDKTSEHHFIGSPIHTIEDVKRMCENAIIKAYNFDYNKKITEAITLINEQKKLMDEVNEFAKNREK